MIYIVRKKMNNMLHKHIIHSNSKREMEHTSKFKSKAKRVPDIVDVDELRRQLNNQSTPLLLRQFNKLEQQRQQ